MNKKYYEVIGNSTGRVIGVCSDIRDVLVEEPKAKFAEISEWDFISYDESPWEIPIGKILSKSKVKILIDELDGEDERAEELKEVRETFPNRLVFEFLPKFYKLGINYRLFSDNDKVILKIDDFNHYIENEIFVVSEIDQWKVGTLENYISDKEAEKAEAQRQNSIRIAALGKLNDEEKKVLGIK